MQSVNTQLFIIVNVNKNSDAGALPTRKHTTNVNSFVSVTQPSSGRVFQKLIKKNYTAETINLKVNKTGNVRINVKFRRVRATIVAVEKQYYIF